MSLAIVFVLAVAAVVYVAYPLFRQGIAHQLMPLGATPSTVVIHGVAYESEEEWAIDRALGKAEEGELTASPFQWQAELADEIERWVAAIRAERKKARLAAKRLVCPECSKPFQAGDRFCARCGAPHPRVCPRCGERYGEGDLYCVHCGAALARRRGR